MAFTAQNVLDRAARKLGIYPLSTDNTTLFLEYMDECHSILDATLSQFGQGWKATQSDINIVANTYIYALTAPAYCIQAVHFKVGDYYVPLVYDPNILRETYNPTSNTDRGIEKWALRDNSLYIMGIPDTAKTAGLRVLTYPDSSDYAVATSPTEVNFIRTMYIMYCCMANNEETGKYKDHWEALMRKFIQVAQNRYQGPQVIFNEMS